MKYSYTFCLKYHLIPGKAAPVVDILWGNRRQQSGDPILIPQIGKGNLVRNYFSPESSIITFHSFSVTG
jgi:hypothetical protein